MTESHESCSYLWESYLSPQGLGFWDEASIFCIGVLGNGIFSLQFCPEIDEHCYISHSRFNVLADGICPLGNLIECTSEPKNV